MQLIVHAYSWFLADWFHSERVASMSLQERGLYREILDLLYSQGSIGADEPTVIKLVRCEPKEFRNAWPKVKECLYLDQDGRYRNRRVDVELSEIAAHRARKSKAGKVGNEARWKRSQGVPVGIAVGSQPDRKDIAPLPLPLPHPLPHPHPHQRSDLSEMFLAVFDAYPEHRRDKSHQTQSAFTEIMAPRSDEDHPKLQAKILDSIERAKASDDWARENGRFVPNLKKFLEEMHWVREYRAAPTGESTEQRMMRLAREMESKRGNAA